MNVALKKEDAASHLLRSGRLLESEAVYTELYRARPYDTNVLVGLAEIALQTMRLRLAVNLMSRAVTLAPANPTLRYKLGTVQRWAGLSSAAAASFRTTMTLSPRSVDAVSDLSIALEELGQRRDAQRLRGNLGMTLPTVHRVETLRERTVVLTIDDGPSPEVTPVLLSILGEAGIKASFFVTGQRAVSHPDLIAAISAAGHDVLSHGYSHREFATGDCDPVAELEATERLLSRVRPSPSPYWIRLPFGTGWNSAALHGRIAGWRRDAALAQWARLFYDWRFLGRCGVGSSLDAVCRDAVEQALAVPPPSGTILLMHDLPWAARHPLAASVAPVLLRELLEALRCRGYGATSLSGLQGQGQR